MESIENLSGLALTDTSSIRSSDADNGDWGKYIPLHRAIIKADWEEANEIISKDKDALSAEIDDGGETALHIAAGIAVATPKSILFVKNLLEYINPESLESLVDNFNYNPLHRAAIVGYTEVAEMLVNKNRSLLFCCDKDSILPIHRAVYNSQKTTFIYLLKACKEHIEISTRDGYYSPFEGTTGAKLLNNVIAGGYLGELFFLPFF